MILHRLSGLPDWCYPLIVARFARDDGALSTAAMALLPQMRLRWTNGALMQVATLHRFTLLALQEWTGRRRVAAPDDLGMPLPLSRQALLEARAVVTEIGLACEVLMGEALSISSEGVTA